MPASIPARSAEAHFVRPTFLRASPLPSGEQTLQRTRLAIRGIACRTRNDYVLCAQVNRFGTAQTPLHRNLYSLAVFVDDGAAGGVAKNKIKAYSPNVLDYPGNMSMWEKESLAAEACLAAERKARKPSKKKVARAIGDSHRKRAT